MGKAQPTAKPTAAIAYYRVSTQKQGRSGLGLDSQRTSVASYCRSNGLTITGEYTEVESGRHRKRKELAAALDQAKRTNARLVIAKLDRLARDVGFVMTLKESGADFQACDMTDMNTLNVGIYAVIAQDEAEKISARTKAALAAAKARGTKLGKPENMTAEAQRAGATAQRDLAREAYSQLSHYVGMLRDSGLSFMRIAERLTQDGYRTRNGAMFTPATVQRMLARAA